MTGTGSLACTLEQLSQAFNAAFISGVTVVDEALHLRQIILARLRGSHLQQCAGLG